MFVCCSDVFVCCSVGHSVSMCLCFFSAGHNVSMCLCVVLIFFFFFFLQAITCPCVCVLFCRPSRVHVFVCCSDVFVFFFCRP